MNTKKNKSKIVLIDGVRYHAERPKVCRMCFFWKNRKIGCILGGENCYYLAESVKTEREKEFEACCYSKEKSCVGACCYKRLMSGLHAKQNRKKVSADHV